jgi:nucleoside-diphosphate-sugar epimerase
VFGAGDPTRRIAAYLDKIEEDGELQLPAETCELPAAIAWVKDVGFGVALAADPRKPIGVYEVGFADVSVRRLVEAFAAAMGQKPRITPVPAAELPAGASPYDKLAEQKLLERARLDLGFEPSPLQDAIAETLAWYRVARLRRSNQA